MMLSRRTLLFSSLAATAQTAKRPNLLVIISDDHHWQCLGANGNPHIRTPNLDKLAARGVLFPQAVISTPQCAPSRGILLSGLETYQTGLDSNGYTSYRTYTGPTVVEQLRRSGYETVLVGKWHIDNLPGQTGFSRAPLWLRTGGSNPVNPKLRRGLDAPDAPVEGHITDLFTNAAIDAIQGRDNQKPWLLWLAHTAPHSPWNEPPQYRRNQPAPPPPAHPKTKGEKSFDWPTYYSVVEHLDDSIGKLTQALEQSGQWDNTLILFLGDNGFLCGSRGLNGKVYPWEESIRIPFLASGGLVRKSQPSDAPVASIDVPATLLDYAGLRSPYPLSGNSLKPVLSASKPFQREFAFSSWNDGRVAAVLAGYAVEPYRAVRTARHKLIVWESKKQALFDLAQDPAEERNLLDDPAHAATRKRLTQALRKRMRQTRDPALAWLG